MSRSGYSDECENLNLYRANVDRTIAGRRGQAFLAEMAAALDAMPDKRLVAGLLVEDGEACAMGAVALRRGLDVSRIDDSEASELGSLFGISRIMAAEIAYINDECGERYGRPSETPEERWTRVRAWVAENTRLRATIAVADGGRPT